MALARRPSGVRRWLAVSRELDHDGEGRAAPLVEVVALSVLADQQLARTLILDPTWLEDTSHAGVRLVSPPGYYAAFVLDPDGNNIEAIFREA